MLVKKLLGIVVSVLLTTSCSEKESTVDLLEICADELFKKKYERGLLESNYLTENYGLTASQFIEMDLKDKLKHKFQAYEIRYKKCETEAAQYPKAFKAKYAK